MTADGVMSVGGVTTADMAAAVSDDSGDSDFFNSSLSIWRGPRSSLEGEYEPVPLDLHTACSIGNFDVVRMYINRLDHPILYMCTLSLSGQCRFSSVINLCCGVALLKIRMNNEKAGCQC